MEASLEHNDSSTSTLTHSTTGVIPEVWYSKPWKRESCCCVCETPLGFGRAKKRGCKVCGHAVCPQCSTKKKAESTGRLERLCKSCEAEQVNQEIRLSYPDSSKLFEMETRLTKEIISRQQAETRLQRALRSIQEASANSSMSPSKAESSIQVETATSLTVQRAAEEQISPERRVSPSKPGLAKLELSLSPPQQLSVCGLQVPSMVGDRSSEKKLSLSRPQLSSIAGRRATLSLQRVEAINVLAPCFLLEESKSEREHGQTFTADLHALHPGLKDASHAGRLETVAEDECTACKQHQASIKRLLTRLEALEHSALPSRRSQPELQTSKNCQCTLA